MMNPEINNEHSTNMHHNDDIKDQEMKDNEQSSNYQPKHFKVEVDYLLESKDKGTIKSKVIIRGVLNDDGKYSVWRKILRIDPKEIKMSPSWLSTQRQKIAEGILTRVLKIS